MISIEKFEPQGEAILALEQQLRDNRVTHAMLITGAQGVGKWTLATAVTAALLCETPADNRQPLSCGHCRSCIQMENLSHPDLTILELGKPLVPTETKTVIPVSDIEEMIRRISRQGYQGSKRIVLIHHAEDMNPASQNKLLKTLEEPPENVYFLLTSEKPESLLPTIVSRCRPLTLHRWQEKDVLRVLSEHGFSGEKAKKAAQDAGGSFGQALAIMGDEGYWSFRNEVIQDFLAIDQRSDIVATSAKWKDRKSDSHALFTLLEGFFSHLMRSSLGISHMDTEAPERWRQFAERAEASDYVKLLDAVQTAQQRISSQVNFQIVIEQMLLSFMEAVS